MNSSQEPRCAHQIPSGIYSHLRKKMLLFKPRPIDESFVQAQRLYIDKKKGQPNGLKHKRQQGISKEGKNKWK